MNDIESAGPETKPAKAKRTLIIIVVAVAVAAAMYGVGWWQGRAQLAAQKADFERQLQDVRGELEQTRDELAVAENRGRLMQALAALYRTTVDLDQRNFGIANTHLQEAADALGQIKDASGGLDLEQLSELRTEIEETDINVAVDLEDQRTMVVGFANELEALIPDAASSDTGQ